MITCKDCEAFPRDCTFLQTFVFILQHPSLWHRLQNSLKSLPAKARSAVSIILARALFSFDFNERLEVEFCFYIAWKMLFEEKSLGCIKQQRINPPREEGNIIRVANAPDNARFVSKLLFGHFKTGWIFTENIFAESQRNGKTVPILTEVIKVDLSLQLEEETLFRRQFARQELRCSAFENVKREIK